MKRAKIRLVSAWILLAAALVPSGSKAGAPAPFAIYFSEAKVTLSGPIDTKESADRLANAILEALPEIRIVNGGLVFDGKSALPDEKLFHSLVVEVALSTHEGEIECSEDQLLVGGLTDSVMIASVLKLRAAPIIGKRRYKDRLCQVPSEDLPEIPLVLSTGESRKAFSFDLSLVEAKREAFVVPGVLLEKMLGLIEGTADFAFLLGGQPAVAADPAGLAATAGNPAEVVSAPAVAVPAQMTSPSASAAEPVAPLATQAVDPFEELGPVFFGRNSFLLQSGQDQNVSNVIEQLGAAPWIGKPVILRVTTYKAGSPGFSSWLGERRGAELVKQMTAAGVARDLITIQLAEAPETAVDEGKVNVLLPRGAAPPDLPR